MKARPKGKPLTSAQVAERRAKLLDELAVLSADERMLELRRQVKSLRRRVENLQHSLECEQARNERLRCELFESLRDKRRAWSSEGATLGAWVAG